MDLRSPYDGSAVRLDPERSMQVQRELGSDVVMVFDECTPWPADRAVVAESMCRSLRWASRSKRRPRGPARRRCSESCRAAPGRTFAPSPSRGLAAIGFDGYAIGGLAVGEPMEERLGVLEGLVPRMPPGGAPVPHGGRDPGGHRGGGPARRGPLRLRAPDPERPQRTPVRPGRGPSHPQSALPRGCAARSRKGAAAPPALAFSRAYLHHLDRSGEILGARLATLHNLHHYQKLMADLRARGARRERLRDSGNDSGQSGVSLWHNFRLLSEPIKKGRSFHELLHRERVRAGWRGGRTVRHALGLRSSHPHLRGVLVPADPAPAEEGEGAPGDGGGPQQGRRGGDQRRPPRPDNRGQATPSSPWKWPRGWKCACSALRSPTSCRRGPSSRPEPGRGCAAYRRDMAEAIPLRSKPRRAVPEAASDSHP